MKYSRSLLISLLMFSAITANAAGKKIMCDEPMGPRLDYFIQNSANLQNDQFLVGKDQMAGMHARVVFSDNNQDVSFVVSDAAQLPSLPEQNNMKVVFANQQQVTFMGNVNDAPLLATYYPTTNILIYSQQSTWPGDTFSGARAIMFYARCHDVMPAATAAPAVGGAAMPAAPAAPAVIPAIPATPAPNDMAPAATPAS